MSKSSQLKRAINDAEREITALEHKRERPLSALMHAVISGTEPSAEDKEYFRVFTVLIDDARENLRKLYAELAEIEGKKKKQE